MTSGGEVVEGLLRALDERLRPAARASWVTADGAHAASGAPLTPEVADLLPGLAHLLRRETGLFDGGSGRVTFEVGERALLVHALGADGMVVIDARAGLNLALLRCHVEAVVAELVARRPADAPLLEPRRLPVRRPEPAAAVDAVEALGSTTAPGPVAPEDAVRSPGTTGSTEHAGSTGRAEPTSQAEPTGQAPSVPAASGGTGDADATPAATGPAPSARRMPRTVPARRTLVPRQRADVDADAADRVRHGAADGSTLGRVLAALLDHDA